MGPDRSRPDLMKFLFVEIIFPLICILFVRALFKSMFAGFRSATTPQHQRSNRQEPVVSAGGELKKDPVCGTYVSTATSLSQKVNGQLVYFCSPECRAKFR